MATYGSSTYGSGTYGAGSTSGTVSATLTIGPLSLVATGPGSSTGTAVLNLRLQDPRLQVQISGGTPPGPIIVPPQIGPLPLLVVEISFASNPNALPSWTDVTAYVQSLSINRGRQRELDTIQSGTCTVVLNDISRAFDPTNTSSPYYPNVLPMRRVRVRATWNGSNYFLWSGYVQSWGMNWPTWGDSLTTIVCADGFLPINLAQLNQTFPAETSDQRVNDVLTAIGWTAGGFAWILNNSILGVSTVVGPTGDRVIGSGQSTVGPANLSNTSALQHLQDVTNTEMGLLFMNKQGAVTFYGRNYLALPSHSTSLATFGELELVYASVSMDFSDNQIWNDLEITPTSGNLQSAGDVNSQAQYYKRTLSRNTLHVDDPSALSQANLLLRRYAQPTLQIDSMTLDGTADPNNIYPQMLGREIGDMVTVNRRPPGSSIAISGSVYDTATFDTATFDTSTSYGGNGPMISQPSQIQGINISYSAEGGLWTVVWRLTPGDTSTYWQLNDPVYGILGSTTRLFS